MIDLTEDSQPSKALDAAESSDGTDQWVEEEEEKEEEPGFGSGLVQTHRTAELQGDLKRCPMCQKPFPRAMIEIHASDCQGGDSDDSDRVVKLSTLWGSK